MPTDQVAIPWHGSSISLERIEVANYGGPTATIRPDHWQHECSGPGEQLVSRSEISRFRPAT